MKISVVTSLYNSSAYIEEFYNKVSSAVKSISNDFEIILVNDGSPDNSLDKAIEIYNKPGSHLKILDLSRNFGQHKALITGLKYSTGDIVFMLDSDLEEDPIEIQRFYNLHKTEHSTADVIYGVQETRKGGFFERISGSLFYKLFNMFSSHKVLDNPTPFRLMTRKYVDALMKFEEKELFFLGVSLLNGFDQIPVVIKKGNGSPSGYNLLKKINQSVNAITSFTNTPLLMVFYLGVIVSVLAGFYFVYILYLYFVLSVGVEGWTSIMVSLWLVGGLTISSLGIIGIYISKIFSEVKNRPLTIIRNVYE